MELAYRLQTAGNLKVVFLPEALAEHLHPTDFGKACKRAYGTGLALRIFDRIWPGVMDPPHGRMHVAVRGFLSRNAWLLGPATSLVGGITRVWCPNPLIRWLLAYQTAVARTRNG